MAQGKAAIEFGTSKVICLIEGQKNSGISIPGSACVRYDGLQEGEWVNYRYVSETVQNAVEMAEDRVGRQLRSAIVGIPGCFTHIVMGTAKRVMPEGRVEHEDIRKMLQMAMPKVGDSKVLVNARPGYFLDDKEELYIDPPVGLRTRRLKGYLCYAFADKKFLSNVANLLGHLHIQIHSFQFENQAQAMFYIPQKNRDRCAILLDIGYRDTNVSVVFGDSILAHDVLYMGGETLVDALEKELEIDPILAENLKRSYIFGIGMDSQSQSYAKNEQGKMVSVDARRIRRIVEEFANQLCREIGEILKDFGPLFTPDTPVFLVGGGMRMRGAETYLSARLSRPVYVETKSKSLAFSPVYNSALALLDNTQQAVYDLKDEGLPTSIGKKILGVFHR